MLKIKSRAKTGIKKMMKSVFPESAYAYLALCHTSKITGPKFLILLQGRSGSQLLGDLLNCHPDIHCDTEKIGWKQWSTLFDLKSYLKWRRKKRTEPIYGFRFKLRHVTEVQDVNVAHFLRHLHRRGWKIIYCKRENRLRQEISSLIGNQRNKWSDTSAEPLVGQKFEIECQQLLSSIEARERYAAQEEEVLAGLPHLTIVYEKDLLNAKQHQATLDRVFDYLGVPSVPVKTTLVRTSGNNLGDIVSNYEEIVRFISQTKYAKFIDEPYYAMPHDFNNYMHL